jgi:long-chain acyl-CoA synthetase
MVPTWFSAPKAGQLAVQEVCTSKEACKWAQQELEKCGRSEGLKGFEIVKSVHLTGTAFTDENNLMTPSFKLKRPQLKKAYQDQLDKMYSNLER